ncbi:Asp23/Gls24 family envelope stress response protein [Streptococcus caprae]|uniref:Asp23/Gls24 family envelope stress response protein n=1 Tax=Streptococcus caprae TaxID=1640501 RepID=A0ABV8CWJ3_9STRE
MANEAIGEIVISPRVLEVITGIAATKVKGVHSLENQKVADSFSKSTLGRGVYLQTDDEGVLTADIYLYLQYGVNVPAVSIEIQKAVKSAIYDMAEVVVDNVNVHVVGIATEKSAKPDMTHLFDEDFLDD